MFEDNIITEKEENTISDSVNNFNYNINKFLVYDINNINGIDVEEEFLDLNNNSNNSNNNSNDLNNNSDNLNNEFEKENLENSKDNTNDTNIMKIGFLYSGHIEEIKEKV